MARARAPRQAGFTFVESLIAMALMAFIVTELGLVMSYAARNTNLSQRIARANALADEAIEKSRNTAYPSIQLPNSLLGESCTMSGFIATCTSSIDGGRYTRVRRVSPLDTTLPVAGLTDLATSFKCNVDVAVSFTDSRGNAQVIRVASIISRR